MSKGTDKTVSAIAALLGARGGSRRTPKQLAAVKKNVIKAQAARRKKIALAVR